MKKFITFILCLVLALSLTACNGAGGPSKGSWENVGVEGTFDADVKGALTVSTVSEEGDINMKWTGSNEQSLDNTIDWLREQGYNSLYGGSASKSSEQGGKLISYTAQKTVGGSSSLFGQKRAGDLGDLGGLGGLGGLLGGGDSKTMIAESYYVAEDFTLMGTEFKAGELYLDIYEDKTFSLNSLMTAWPETQIQKVVGESIPAFTGATGFSFMNQTMGAFKMAVITAFGATEANATAYRSQLVQNGYTAVDDYGETLTKSLADGGTITVDVWATEYALNPETFQMESGVEIYLTVQKGVGDYDSWSDLNLGAFSSAGIPAFAGGDSFDMANMFDMYSSGFDFEDLEDMLDQLGPFESLLSPEEKAELAQAREIIKLAAQVKTFVITVYGATEDEILAYETALQTAGFVDYEKIVGQYWYSVAPSETRGTCMITVVSMPLQLYEYTFGEPINPDDPDSPVGPSYPEPDDGVGYDDLPTNLRFTANMLGFDYVVTKINDNYLTEFITVQYYYEKTNSGYNIWHQTPDPETYETVWQVLETIPTLSNDVVLISTITDVLFDNDVDGLAQGGTETIAGKTCTVYSDTDLGTKKITSEGFVFNYSMMGLDFLTITEWDTTVTNFGDFTPPTT